jgi:hypothetical protein
MNLEPEDLISPEDEAEMQRNFINGHSEDVIEHLQRAVIFMEANKEQVTPDVLEFMREAFTRHATWMRQNGIGLPQQDIDGREQAAVDPPY